MDVRTKEIFRSYLQEAIGEEKASVAFSAFDEPASISVRKNPFKHSALNLPFSEQVPWCDDGFFLDNRPVFTLDPHFHAGAYYVQDSSSMFVGYVARIVAERFKERKILRVLDLCAAPGGKTTDIAASLRAVRGNDFILISNEVMKQRASVLASNAALWGDPCVVVTSDDPVRFSALEGYFDIILADVPCSGEGMFRKDKEAEEQWSPENVTLCQGRQRRIVADVWPALADGGVLIYSTCTFNRYENDLNVQWIARELGAEVIGIGNDRSMSVFNGVAETEFGFSLVPGLVKGEGQYCSALCKRGGAEGGFTAQRLRQECCVSGRQSHKVSFAASELFEGDLRIASKGEMLKVVPEPIYGDISMLGSFLHVILSGCAVGVLKNGTLVPDPDMAFSVLFRKEAFPCVELDIDSALSYLKGIPPVLPSVEKGFVTICYGSLPLGFVKNLGNRSNNLYPKGRRIRMEIKK